MSKISAIIFTLGCHRRRRVVVPCVRPSIRLSVQSDVTALTLLGFQLSAWNLVGWCTVPWSRSLSKMTMLCQFSAFHRTFKFSMISLDQVWGMVTHVTHIRKCEEITSWPENWWHDTMYHEADHHLKWPRSTNVRIFWSRPAEGAVVPWTACALTCLFIDAINKNLFHRTNFVITASCDGHVKFWKKLDEEGIEFVKHFRTHIGIVPVHFFSHFMKKKTFP